MWKIRQGARGEKHTGTTTKETERLKREADGIEFDVRKSIRYHSKRRAFFNAWHYISLVITALSGTAAFASLVSESDKTLALWLTGIIAVITVLDLSIGFSRHSDAYNNLERKFADLLIKITLNDPSEANNKEWKTERLLIEKDEPPTLKVLEQVCYNEEALAQGTPEYICHIPWLMMRLRHFFLFDGWNPILLSEKEAVKQECRQQKLKKKLSSN